MNLKKKYPVLLLIAALIIMLGFGVTQTVPGNQLDEKKNLMGFAYANCMFWYFKSKNYDLQDISAIAGGYLETGHSSMDRYQAISLYIKNYHSTRKTKQQIDPQLLKCFYLDENAGLLRLINQ